MNMPATRELIVWFRDRRVAVLRDAGPTWGLDYDTDWMHADDGFDLSPALPRVAGRIEDGGSQRPVQWFFDNLLPEEDARALLAQEAHIPQADAFGLLGWYGAESAGALVLLPPGQETSAGGLQRLPDAVLSERIRNLPRRSLTEGAPKRMSMAGAQHKLAVVILNGELYEPIGSTPSTEILKPDHVLTEQYPHSVANEWFCMRLAERVGMQMPEVAIRYVPEPIYLVQRFDREGTWPDVQRRHVLDACQLLSLDRAYKYQQSTPTTLARLVEMCREKASTRQRLFRWAVFNTLIGNGDAHLKNLSFYVDASGIQLTPHYDLVSTTSYAEPGKWGDAEMSLPIGDAVRFHELRRHHILDFGQVIGIPPLVTGRLLDEVLRDLADAAAAEVGRFETGASPVVDAGEQRQIRLIVSGVMRDMRDQLA